MTVQEEVSCRRIVRTTNTLRVCAILKFMIKSMFILNGLIQALIYYTYWITNIIFRIRKWSEFINEVFPEGCVK